MRHCRVLGEELQKVLKDSNTDPIGQVDALRSRRSVRLECGVWKGWDKMCTDPCILCVQEIHAYTNLPEVKVERQRLQPCDVAGDAQVGYRVFEGVAVGPKAAAMMQRGWWEMGVEVIWFSDRADGIFALWVREGDTQVRNPAILHTPSTPFEVVEECCRDVRVSFGNVEA